MITINVNQREMYIPDDEKILGVRRDNDTMVKVFRVLRYTLAGIDISDYAFKILFVKEDGVDGIGVPQEVTKDDSYVYVKWAVGREAVEVPGTVKVMLEAVYTDGDNNILQAWHSVYGEFIVNPAHDNLEPDELNGQYRDLVNAMKIEMVKYLTTNTFFAELDITEPDLNKLMYNIFYGSGSSSGGNTGGDDTPTDPSNPDGGGSSSGGNTGGTDNPTNPNNVNYFVDENGDYFVDENSNYFVEEI